MSDYGLKITKDGIDLGSVTNLNDYIFHSSYPQLNVYMYGSFTKNFVGGGEDTLTIVHNLGYEPFAFVYMQNYDGLSGTVTSEYYQLDWSTRGAIYENYAEARIDNTNLVIAFNDTYNSRFVTLSGFYYIFYNPAT